jgi:putative MATE family efflux protein
MQHILTKGRVSTTLLKLALPIMATSFLQMAYNLIDMFWIGHLGSSAVAAVGTAGFFIWLSFAIILLSKIGAEVLVAQNLGAGDTPKAETAAGTAVVMAIVNGAIFGAILIVFRFPLIHFFQLGDLYVESSAIVYLTVMAACMPFSFLPPVFTGIMNGSGNSRTPFIINTIGLITNMILDPLLIFGIGGFAGWGVLGAAIATVIAQGLVVFCFLVVFARRGSFLPPFFYLGRFKWEMVKEIFKLGIPVSVQSGIFTLIAMILARLIAGWGPTAIAVQKVGSQIESISWMTASGFQAAVSAFTGQNAGSKKIGRVKEGVRSALRMMFGIGMLATIIMFFFAEPIFSIFLSESEALSLGIDYLRILAFSQVFMSLEITTAGAFNGLGKTMPPSIIGVGGNLLRIPMALLFIPSLGLNGIWWAICISSILKGVMMMSWYWKNESAMTQSILERFSPLKAE